MQVRCKSCAIHESLKQNVFGGAYIIHTMNTLARAYTLAWSNLASTKDSERHLVNDFKHKFSALRINEWLRIEQSYVLQVLILFAKGLPRYFR